MKIQEWRELCDRVSKKPWYPHKAKTYWHVKDHHKDYIAQNIYCEADAVFISGARYYFPLLLDVAQMAKIMEEHAMPKGCECSACENLRAALKALEDAR